MLFPSPSLPRTMHVHAPQRLWAPTRIHIGLGKHAQNGMGVLPGAPRARHGRTRPEKWALGSGQTWRQHPFPPTPPPLTSRSRLSNLLLDDRFTSAVTAVTYSRPGARKGETLQGHELGARPLGLSSPCRAILSVGPHQSHWNLKPRALQASLVVCLSINLSF